MHALSYVCACCPDRILINSCKEVSLFSKDRSPSRESVEIVLSLQLHPDDGAHETRLSRSNEGG